MPENTVALQISTAPVISLFRLVDHQAEIRPEAPALGSLTYSDLKQECLRLKRAEGLTTVDILDPLGAIPYTLGNLTNGAVAFSERSRAQTWEPGELLLPDPEIGERFDEIRLPQDRLVRSARALAARYGFSDTDRLWVNGPLDDPGTWLVLAAALFAGVPIALSPEAATILWDLSDDAPDLEDTARVVHARTDREALSDLQRQHPNVTFVNGLALAAGGGLPVCSDPRDPRDTVPSTLGRPLGDTEVMIVDRDTGMDKLLYETGEIWLRRGSTTVGYTSGRSALAEADFLPTGLIGYLDSEGRLVLGDAAALAA